MDNWQNYDISTSPYFSPQDVGDGGITMGAGNGSDWFNWQGNSAFSLGDLGKFYTAAQQNGDSSTDASVDQDALQNWLAQNNYNFQIGQGSQPGYEGRRLFDNNTGQQVGDAIDVRMTPTMMESIAAGLGQMALNPLTGVAGVGGPTNAMLSAGLNSFGHGGDLGDIAKSAAISGGLDFMPDVGGLAGVENNTLKNMINSGVKGAISSGLQGGNPLKGGVMSSAVTGLNSIGSAIPDVGTLGGTMSDNTGETSSTMGGYASPTQLEANMQATSADPTMSFNSTSSGGTDLMSNISNLLGFNTGKLGVGDALQGLASLYMYNKQRKMAKDFRNQIAGNRDAYGQQLRQQLSRRDAASGRRSDYGGREVELQAGLAALDSRNAPAFAQLQQLEMGGLMGMLNSGLVTGQRAGWWGGSTPTAPSIPTSGYGSTLPSLSQLGGSSPYSLLEDTNKKKYSLLGGS